MPTPQYFLLNTNLARHPQDHRFMLDNHVVAAFEDGYKEKIARIAQGDYVFLYASKRGIVAYGRANSNVQQTDHLGIANQTFYQQLNPFISLEHNPLPACEIKTTLGHAIAFVQTLSRITDGENLLHHLQNREQKG